MSSTKFSKIVWAHYKKNGRHDLPWRQTKDPYRILVSEVMLQQTQVERVIPFYAKFIKQFPTAKKLSIVPLSDVLKAWQGLGYNRRAKMLQAAAKEITSKHQGLFPREVGELENLPGIGPYTARAVAAFAFNQDVIFIETNIRTAVIHHFFPKKGKVSDAQIMEVLEIEFPKGKSRDWYAALMDYGAHLKQSGIRLNSRSKQYSKQPRFSGSNREARGAILRELSQGPATRQRLLGLLGDDRIAQSLIAHASLLSEGLIQKRGNRFQLPR